MIRFTPHRIRHGGGYMTAGRRQDCRVCLVASWLKCSKMKEMEVSREHIYLRMDWETSIPIIHLVIRYQDFNHMNQEYGTAGATSPEKAKFIAQASQQDPNYLHPFTQSGFQSDNTYMQQAGVPTVIGQNPNPNTLNGYSPQPAPATPQDPYRAAFNEYLQSLKTTPEERSAKEYLNTLTSNARMASEKALQSGETMGFAGGEQARVNRNNQLAIDAAARNLEAITGYRAGEREASKARAEFEGTLYKTQQESQKPFELGQGQERYTFNPSTGKYEKTAANPKVAEPRDPLEDAYKRAQIANIDSLIKDRANNPSNPTQFTIPKPAKNNLMKFGFKADEVSMLEKDIQQYGLTKALEGLDSATIDLVTRELDKDLYSQ